jgi:3-phosphoshikimate 1-carboxyvinyltransferase|tara:strand:- start:6780 stop:8129 length:1350 start_codon:yes stop_codon:yes gene_type:complete
MAFKKFSLVISKSIKSFNKSIKVDSDKSISIRFFLIGSICQNISCAKNVLESEDVFSAISCLRKLGVKIEKINSGEYKVYGKGLGSLYANRKSILHFGNSGTLARLLTGILTSTPNIKVRLIGDHSLNKRSMKKLIDLMSSFGADFYPKKKFTFPLIFTSSAIPLGINYNSGVSAQLKSAVILAGLNSFGKTTINEKFFSRDHTENMLKNNKNLLLTKKNNQTVINVNGKEQLKNLNLKVPGDPSSAAFFTAITLMSKKSSLLIKNVGLNPKRIGFYKLLKKNGALIKFKNIKKTNNEIVGDIFVQSSKLKPINASKEYYLNTTDEYPLLFVMASLIKGNSSFVGISDLVNKESNRIVEMQKILKQIGVRSSFKKGKLTIFGKTILNSSKKRIIVPNLGDHRICMTAAVLALSTGISAKINNFETVRTSSPSFLKTLRYLGGIFEIKKK